MAAVRIGDVPFDAGAAVVPGARVRHCPFGDQLG